MKFGAQGWLTRDLSQIPSETIHEIAEIGFHGVTSHINPVYRDRLLHDSSEGREFADTVRASGLEYLQLWGPYGCLISPDEGDRRHGVEEARDLVEITAAMGIPATGIRPTGLNPMGNWRPHKDHYSDEVEQRFIRSLSEISETAVDRGVQLVLELGSGSLLYEPEKIRRIIQATDPKTVRVNIDPVNFMLDFRAATDSTPVINRLFDILGPYSNSVHIKDFTIEDRHVVHIAEVFPGEGLLDMDTVLRRTEELGPDTWAIIEHLPPARIPAALQYLQDKTAALGITSADPITLS